MDREVRGGSGGRAPAKAVPGASVPVRTNRRYGAVAAATPLDRDLTFGHLAASEGGYHSLASRAEGPAFSAAAAAAAGGGERTGGLAQLLRRVVVGGIVVTLFAAAVSTLYGGQQISSSEPGVRGVSAEYPKMAAEVSAEVSHTLAFLCFLFC